MTSRGSLEKDVLYDLRFIAKKCALTGLTLHRTQTCVLVEKPIAYFVRLPRAFREADLVVCVVSVDQILHNAT